MKKLKRLRPYKACEPHITINRIRNILRDLEIFTTEQNYNHGEKFYSSRVIINDRGLGEINIGQNGKGLSPKYSLASAYGEFIERLQNDLMVNMLKLRERPVKGHIKKDSINRSFRERLEKEGLLLDFVTAPDERILSNERLLRDSYHILKHLFKEDSKKLLLRYMKKIGDTNKRVCVPFYSVKQKKVEYLPIDLLHLFSSTNGTSAGNTKEEALIQGISEIFERYVIGRIYADELTPPTIPHEYFKGTDIYNKIKFLEKNNNIAITIKDCSLGLNLPVIGVLIIDFEKSRYHFHLGSDPSPITTLERCFTETYQVEGLKYNSRSLHFNQYPFEPRNGLTRDQIKQINYHQTIKNYSGKWPNSIFAYKGDYPFKGFEHPITKSYKEDLKYVCDKVFELGFDLYVREVSYLGFPSFYVYIPGMSEIFHTFDKEYLIAYQELKNKSQIVFSLKKSNKESIKSLALAIERHYRFYVDPPNHLTDVFSLIRNVDYVFSHIMNNDFEKLDPLLFLAMLFYRVDDYDKALKYMNKYLEKSINRDRDMHLYYSCVGDYLKLKKEKATTMETYYVLLSLYPRDIAEKVIEDFSDPKKYLKILNYQRVLSVTNVE